MKFCRSCGSALAGAPPSAMPVPPTIMGESPLAAMRAGGQLPPMQGMPPPGPLPGVNPSPPRANAPAGYPGYPPPAAGNFPQPGAFPPPPTMPPSIPPNVAPQPPGPSPIATPSKAQPAVAPAGGSVACPRCGTQTPSGFAYCQQCGLHIQALQPTDPGQPGGGPPAQRARTPSNAPPRASGVAGAQQGKSAPQNAIDVQAATLAADNVPHAAPKAASGPAWGTAVLVNRDGSDGQRFPLSGEYMVIGRTGSDIEFADDRFLARQHARLERANDGSVRVVPMDTLNGVFRKADAPVDLADGTTILVGREVLRFERVDGEEAKVHPLVRHGVALFGSPPREPWGRLHAVIPSGGYRDVRHLSDKEIVLGREEGDIVFRDDAFMSRRHAALTWDGKKAQLTDLGSSNGTFVRLSGPTTLKHGDHVRLGDQLLRIELGR
jgi:pSer/pThr/pTyr-binding forkhead associated (FHA) protein